MKRISNHIVLLCLTLLVAACNRYEEIYGIGRPVIEFDHPDGVYSVAVGEELTIAPIVENAVDASYEWMLEDSTVVSTDAVWRSKWSRVGEYYVRLTVTAAGGIAREDIRIDVFDPQPPAISLPIPPDGLKLVVGDRYVIAPAFGGVGPSGPDEIRWMIDDEFASTDSILTFQADDPGIYNIKVCARNAVGWSERSFPIEVLESLPSDISFIPLSMAYSTPRRSTVVGRPVTLELTGHFEGAIRWTVDGQPVENVEPCFIYCPATGGVHHVVAENRGSVAAVDVEVLESVSPRQPASESSPVHVFEWTPAPGQFIGETGSVGGMTDDILTADDACRWAESRLALRRFVSLGSWGGYIICGFDGSIRPGGGGFDFAIMGNAISTACEPGVVWVMQDVNGNGLPDDQWYQLKGSEFDNPATRRSFEATYYSPAGSGMSVQWTDADGLTGAVDYMPSLHRQPSYFPAWIDASSLTFYGVRLPSHTSFDSSSGQWQSSPYGWGYADNLGSDLLAGGDISLGLGNWVGFRIANAVLPDGTPVALSSIDFVKIQTGVMDKAGRLGEVSTEVCAIAPASR